MVVLVEKLRRVIESVHGCTAVHAGSATVHEKHGGNTVWYGTVHTFNLIGSQAAPRAFGWALQSMDRTQVEYFTVLNKGPIHGPRDAVRAVLTEFCSSAAVVNSSASATEDDHFALKIYVVELDEYVEVSTLKAD